MCSGSEVGSYSRLIVFVYHSTLVVRAIKQKQKRSSVVDTLSVSLRITYRFSSGRAGLLEGVSKCFDS
jgi:hypothetical protein